MQIEYLADHPSLVPELASLHFGQWGHLRPGESLGERTRRLAASCGRGGMPSVVIALEDGALLGSAMLVEHDMETREDLTPWLAGVYVVARKRHSGVGSALVRRIETEAVRLGIERLYLWTPDMMPFYARLGWRFEEGSEYLGMEVAIMSRRLGSENVGA